MTPAKRLFVITGGPGVGKTSLIEELSRRGFAVMPEVAREIIREQVESGGEALPWKDRQAYAERMLAGSIACFKAARRHSAPYIFFDRGIPDILAYTRLVGLPRSRALTQALAHFRYFEQVFLLPAWEEIYVTDNERKQDFAEAVRTDTLMREAYRDSGYKVIEVPRLPVPGRAEFVLERLRGETT